MSITNGISHKNVEQEARAFLRQRFLNHLFKLNGRGCTVKTQGESTISCTVRAFEPTLQNIIVEDLNTPNGTVYKIATLRTADIKTIDFN